MKTTRLLVRINRNNDMYILLTTSCGTCSPQKPPPPLGREVGVGMSILGRLKWAGNLAVVPIA